VAGVDDRSKKASVISTGKKCTISLKRPKWGNVADTVCGVTGGAAFAVVGERGEEQGRLGGLHPNGGSLAWLRKGGCSEHGGGEWLKLTCARTLTAMFKGEEGKKNKGPQAAINC